MCGIGGWFGGGMPVDPMALLACLRHRGPDGEGLWLDPQHRAALVHTRLAIIDPTQAGAQPMGFAPAAPAAGTKAEFRYWISFNGEIFNFQELRDELENTGETFVGHSDTEVLLRLLVRDGKAAIGRLAGMFAFAFYDGERNYGLLARDAFGIKPLYYAHKSQAVVFASEARALRPLLSQNHYDADALRDTLLWGSVPEPHTPFAEIHQVPAGCIVEWDGAALTVSRWHELTFTGRAPGDAAATTRAALLESVRRHLVSDVPVGVFLSGGIDSSAILALGRAALGRNADLRTFSIGFDDPAYDESATARRTAEHFGARHTEWRMTPAEGRAEISGYLAAMDQPTNDGFNTWCVSKLARREGIKVVLSGLGGDEMFGGYASFDQTPAFVRLHRMLGPARGACAAVLSTCSARGSRWRRLAAFLGGEGTALAAFHVQRGFFTEAEARELTFSLTGRDPGATDWHVPGLPRDARDAVSFLELTRYMRNQLLRDCDVFSMAHGVEVRVPFVDARLFASLCAIPAALRLRAGKQLLLDALPEIPKWVRRQPKRGFRFPFQDWMQDFTEILAAADEKTTVPLVTWYRRWALAAVLLKT